MSNHRCELWSGSDQRSAPLWPQQGAPREHGGWGNTNKVIVSQQVYVACAVSKQQGTRGTNYVKPQEVCCKPKQCHFKLLAVAKRRHHSGNSALCAIRLQLRIKAMKANNVSHNDRFPRRFHRFPRTWTWTLLATKLAWQDPGSAGAYAQGAATAMKTTQIDT